MNALFAIALQKAKQKLQAVTAKGCHDKKESLARIATIYTPSNVAAPAGLTKIRGEDKKVLLGKISPIILSIASHYSDLTKAKIALIHKNRFKLENLYKFCHLKSRKDKNRDENITFEYNQMKIKKVTNTLRDFGNTIDIWSNGFLNYFMVMIDFF